MHPFQTQFALQRKKHITFNNLVFSLKKKFKSMRIPNLKTKTHCCLTYWTSFTSHKAAPLHYHYIQIRVNSMRWRRVNHLSCSPFQEVSNSSNLTNVFNVFLSSLYARQFHMTKPRDTSRKQSLCQQIHWLAAGTCSSSPARMPSFSMK